MLLSLGEEKIVINVIGILGASGFSRGAVLSSKSLGSIVATINKSPVVPIGKLKKDDYLNTGLEESTNGVSLKKRKIYF